MYDFAGGELLLLDKPEGWSSFRLVAYVRRLTGVKKVGHAGTLDPLATGLMLIATGKATKQLTHLTGQDKAYRATLRLGAITDSYDRETPEEAITTTPTWTSAEIEAVLTAFRGPIWQRPPIFSAVKVEGRRAYKAARAGQTLEMPPRQVDIQRLECVSYTPPHELVLDVDCSKGTYIRSLAHDIGQQLRCGAYLSALRRTRIGTFRLEDALTPEQFAERVKE